MEDYKIILLGRILLGRILAEFTRGLGMMSENMQRQVYGEGIAYSDNDFNNCASNIESYVNDLR